MPGIGVVNLRFRELTEPYLDHMRFLHESRSRNNVSSEQVRYSDVT